MSNQWYTEDAFCILSKNFQGLDGELIDIQYKKELVCAMSKLQFPPGLIPTYNTNHIGVLPLSAPTKYVVTYISKEMEEEKHE